MSNCSTAVAIDGDIGAPLIISLSPRTDSTDGAGLDVVVMGGGTTHGPAFGVVLKTAGDVGGAPPVWLKLHLSPFLQAPLW